MDVLDIIISILAIIALVFIVYNIVLYCKYKKLHRNEHYSAIVNDKKVVLFKTHIWNDSLEKFAKKIKNETRSHNIDFYILMHDEKNNIRDKINDTELKINTITFNEAEIKKLYDKGFYSMWLCNHWILMWFYRQFKDKYDYFWTIEYDVRISGNSSRIWTYDGKEDFVYPIPEFHHPTWTWRNHYTGKKFNDETKWYGYLQLTRYSNRFLDYLDKNFIEGENGQDELIIYSLYKEGEFSGNHTFLNRLIDNSWSVSNTDSVRHKQQLTESDKKYETDSNQLRIFHPVK